MIKRIVVGISGASGVNLGKKFIELLPKDIEVYTIITNNAKIVANREKQIILDNSDISECTASGSFKTDVMAIIPCSMNTLAKVSCGIADNLLTRSASVMLKERRHLLLAPREMPFGQIALENMLKLSKMGVTIAPPVLAYYSNQNSLEKMEDFMIGKWFDLLNIEHDLYERWKG